MTNNPTIDGVSRELLERVSVLGLSVTADQSAAIVELRALLSAPTNDLREHCKQCAEVVKTWPEWKRDCLGGASVVERQPHVCSCPSGNGSLRHPCLAHHEHEWDINEHGTATVCSICGIRSSDAPPELAALQSTIAQLQAQLAAQKENLESAVNNSIMFANKADELQAPVVAVIDEQQAFANWTHEVIGMRGLAKVQRRDEMTVEQEKFALKGWLARACLDATAALNEVKK